MGLLFCEMPDIQYGGGLSLFRLFLWILRGGMFFRNKLYADGSFCIFIENVMSDGMFRKFLCSMVLGAVFQKCHFWHGKVALSGTESSTLGMQKSNF